MNKLALIGYGYWGERFLRYLEEQFTVSLICHRGAPESDRFTPNVEAVLKSDIEAVVIATPIDTHYEIAKKALEYGKHVLCEKPLSMSYSEVCELADLAAKKNLYLVTEFTYTFSEGIKKAHELITQHSLGNLLSMEQSLKYVGRFLKFNVYWLLGSHMLAVRDMFVPLENNKFNIMDNIKGETGVIQVNCDVPGIINISLNFPQRETRIIWYCSEGTVVYNGINQPALSVIKYVKKPGVLSNELIESSNNYEFDELNNLRNAAAFFNEVLNGKQDSRDNLKTALNITKILAELNSVIKP